jgi:hypothetical protein
MHGSELFGARLDNHVQKGAEWSILPAVWLLSPCRQKANMSMDDCSAFDRDACQRLGRNCAAPKTVAKAVTRVSWLWLRTAGRPRRTPDAERAGAIEAFIQELTKGWRV